MAVSQGFGKTVSDSLVFAYDTSDSRNSYRGAPGTNIAAGPSRNYNGEAISYYENGKLFSSNGYTETVYIPTLGYRTVESVEIYNVYSGYGTDGNYNCCPSLFSYAGGQDFVGGTTYTYQIIYKCHSGYTNSNYMYHYEYGPSGYITEYGVHSNGQREHLGDGWYHAWATFTTNAATTSGHKGMWYYQYNVRDKVSVAAISIIPGSIIRPPHQFIDENTTRSNTQALLNLAGSTTVDVSNMSYNNTAQPIFDGSNDYVDLGTDLLISPVNQGWTAEYVFKTTSAGTLQHFNSAEADDFNANWLALLSGKLAVWNVSPGYWRYGSTAFNSNQYYHIAFIQDAGGTNMRFYVNGVAEGGDHVGNVWTATYSALKARYVGRYEYSGSYDRYFNGEIPVVRLHSRALTASEVAQNYHHYKSRYNI